MICERSLADDLAVYLCNLESSILALRVALDRFHRISGQHIKLPKSAIVLLGIDAERPLGTGHQRDPELLWPGMPFNTVSLVIAKYHGITVSNGEGAARQWDGTRRQTK